MGVIMTKIEHEYELKTMKTKKELLKLFKKKGYIFKESANKVDDLYKLEKENIVFFIDMFKLCEKVVSMKKITPEDKQKELSQNNFDISGYDYYYKKDYYSKDWFK